MSADNWRICPACKVRVDELNEARINAPGEAYGKVARDTYEKLLEAAKNLTKLDDTLREDYEIRVDSNGIFHVDYLASCTDCNFSFRYQHKEKTKI